MPIPFNKTLLVAMAATVLTACKSEPMSLQIAHLNDTHSHFDEQVLQIGLPNEEQQLVPTYAYVGGYPRLTTKINDLRNDAFVNDTPFMLLHAGDAFAGTLFFTLYKGQLNADFMNLMQFDAMAIGNHEFDLGNEALAEFSEKLDFPLLSANVKAKGDDELHGKYLPFTIKIYEDQPVAVVGLTTTYTEIISSPSDDTIFSDEIDVAQRTVKHLTRLGINKIVFLTHVGLELDQALAESVPGIDVIIGGHSPELFGDHSNIGLGNQAPSPVLITGAKGDPVCIMHSGEQSLAIGVTDIEFSDTGVVESCRANNVFVVGEVFARGTPPAPVTGTGYQVINDYIQQAPNIEVVAKDLQAQAMLDQAKYEVEQFSSSVIGAVETPLYHVRLPGDTHPEQGALTNGSMVAPHVAASMASKMASLSGKPYIAIMNAGGVRADLIGDITVGDAYTVLPFSSSLVTMTVSGESFAQTLQSNVANAYGISGVAFPYVANVRYAIDLTQSSTPVVSDIQILAEDGVYQALQPDQNYDLVTTSYLAGGGDLYNFPGATDITDTGHIDAEALVQYIQSQPGGVLSSIDSGINLIND